MVAAGGAADDGALAGAGRLDAAAAARLLAADWQPWHCYSVSRGWLAREEGQLWQPDDKALWLRARIHGALEAAKKTDRRGLRTDHIERELEPLLAYRGEWDANPAVAGVADPDADHWRVQLLDEGMGYDGMPTFEDRVSRVLGYVPEAGTPAHFLRLLDHIAPDAAEADWLMSWCGYCLTGHTREHCFVFLHGPGGGGKTVLLVVMRRVLGSYAVGIPDDVLVTKAARHREWLARLAGARLAVVPELPAGTWAHLGTLKALVSGDPQTANYMRRGSFDFTPVAKLMIAGNSKPSLPRTDSGFQRRMRLIPVPAVPPADRDPRFLDKLHAEGPQIAALFIDAARDYLANGLPPTPQRWQAASDDYHADEDTIGQWWADHITAEAGSFAPIADLADRLTHDTGRKHTTTQIREWAAENAPGVNEARRRVNGHANARPGFDGIALRQTGTLTEAP
ncbi:MAG: phage/plasmid primase, P4 family [Acidimicrobiaceae bacterium]|nr:phage/plasmid primase, P4 family [Acidimicrobiaceae bacterium]